MSKHSKKNSRLTKNFSVREQLKDLTKQYDKSENDLKALQSMGQIVGEVLKQLTEEKCKAMITRFEILVKGVRF